MNLHVAAKIAGWIAVAFALGAQALPVRPATDGEYAIVVVGDYHGRGRAVVRDGAIMIDAAVDGPDGAIGRLQAGALAITGAYYAGSASVAGLMAQLHGRLDQPRQFEQGVTAAQMVGLLSDSQGHLARVVGVAQPASDQE